MPMSAPTPCTYPGCGRLVQDGNARCEAHRTVAAREADAGRESAAKRGYGRRWRRYARMFLVDHPICEIGYPDICRSAATVVDHKTPHRGDQRLFWDPTNHQAACKPCHDRKTATEDGGFGRS